MSSRTACSSMACLGQALTDAVPPPRLRTFATRFVAITQLGASLTCEGHVAEFVEHNGERCAKLALTTRDDERRRQTQPAKPSIATR